LIDYSKPGLTALLLAAIFALAACGGAGGGNEGMGGMEGHGNDDKKGDMAGETTGMEGMDHGSMDHGDMAAGMLMEDGEYSDERFIDAMVPHHHGAVEMARVALKNAEHEEIKTLSEEIIVAQEAEIEELRSIKQREFGTSEVPMEMSGDEMEMMGMADPGQLAGQRPFDRAFIDAMIPHHESAIQMAQVAYEESDNEDIRDLASEIVDAQRREIRQMEGWREEWYPEG
jgi:uncharacterized protein (DUF305 family)